MMNESERAPGHIVAVTGGTRGIGASVVRRVARNGGSVVALYRSDDAAAEALRAEVEAEGGRLVTIRADVSEESDIVAAFGRIAELGTLVGLVNSAGIDGGKMRVEDFDADALNATFRTNVVGLMLCCREAVRLMGTPVGQGGAIVNVSSMAATIGGRGQLSHYAASKAAVDTFTVGAAKELAARGVRMFSLRPGATVTDMTAGMRSDPARLAAVERTIAVGRLATADDIAAPIVRLLDEDMAYLSGARIDAAGGGLLF